MLCGWTITISTRKPRVLWINKTDHWQGSIKQQGLARSSLFCQWWRQRWTTSLKSPTIFPIFILLYTLSLPSIFVTTTAWPDKLYNLSSAGSCRVSHPNILCHPMKYRTNILVEALSKTTTTHIPDDSGTHLFITTTRELRDSHPS